MFTQGQMRTMRAGRCYYRTTQADRETDLRSIEDHLVMPIPPRVAAYRLTSRECDRDGLRIVPTGPVSFDARDGGPPVTLRPVPQGLCHETSLQARLDQQHDRRSRVLGL